VRELKNIYENQPGLGLDKHYMIEKVTPKLSIITPYYNSDANLEQTFCCVINQTFEAFEWIIVDDGSTNSQARETLKEFAGRDVRIRILHQENGGQSKAKNYGIREAKTDIIVFLDADDLVEPFWLELLYKALEKYPNAGWSYTDLVGFGSQEYVWCKPFSAGRMTFNNILVNAAAFRKSVIEAVGGFSEIAKYYDEDWALYLKLLGAGYHPVQIPVIGFWYRRSDNGMQQTVRKDEQLRKKSDAYMKQLAKTVDIHIKAEEYKEDLPEAAVRSKYSSKEKILAKILSCKAGKALISAVYKC
jgi:glycosyltransferase involved in cell wall biosynthesis